MTQTHALYRIYGSDDELLYIGITVNPTARFRAHEIEKGWWSQVASIRLEHFDSRNELELAECAAIREEKPRYNIRSNRGRHVLPPGISSRHAVHTVSEAARIIFGQDSGLRDPERWVAMRVRDGRFPGLKIGRRLFMTDADIEAAIETCRSHAPAIPLEDKPAVSIADGLSARSRRRLYSA